MVGKEGDIKHERLEHQRSKLAGEVEQLFAVRNELPVFGGKMLLVAEMFDDSFAMSKTPTDLFLGPNSSLILSPALNGYILEIDASYLPNLALRIRTGTTIGMRCDVSRVQKMRAFGSSDLMRDRLETEVWDNAPEYEKGKGFVIWLAPFRSSESARMC